MNQHASHSQDRTPLFSQRKQSSHPSPVGEWINGLTKWPVDSSLSFAAGASEIRTVRCFLYVVEFTLTTGPSVAVPPTCYPRPHLPRPSTLGNNSLSWVTKCTNHHRSMKPLHLAYWIRLAYHESVSRLGRQMAPNRRNH